MAELKDSGARRNFGTGAVRDVAEGKGRCDLLPLKVLGDYFTCEGKPNELFHHIENYVRGGDTKELFRAMDEFNEWHWKNNRTMFLEVAKQYEDGCQKYGDRNWENGIPLHCYIDSGVRHYLKFLRGDTDEPHDRAFIWNMLGAIWTHENKPELIDLPFADKDKPEVEKSVTGKYDGLSNEELKEIILSYEDIDCPNCPMNNHSNGHGISCGEFMKNYPVEAHKKLLAIIRKEQSKLNGLEGEE